MSAFFKASALLIFAAVLLLMVFVFSGMSNKAYSQGTPTPSPSATPAPSTSPAEIMPTATQTTQAPPSNVAPAAGPTAASSTVEKAVETTPPAEVFPKLNTSEGYVYDPSGRRDPFFPDVQRDEENIEPTNNGSAGTKPTRRIFDPNDPLQKYDLGVYKVIAIVWEVNKPKAIVKDQLGKVYTVHKGTRIGRNNGHVALIREGELIVVEPPSEDGQISGNTHVLELKK